MPATKTKMRVGVIDFSIGWRRLMVSLQETNGDL
jgi:hypothetical protein